MNIWNVFLSDEAKKITFYSSNFVLYCSVLDMMTKLLSGMRLLFVTGINLQAHIAAYQCYFTEPKMNGLVNQANYMEQMPRI